MKLRDYLLDVNVTQVEFAKLVGINRPYLNLIIRGRRIPGKHLAVIISNMTGGVVSSKSLMDGSGAYTGGERGMVRRNKLSKGVLDEMASVIKAKKEVKNGDSRQ
jgi:hypothetical protein